MSHDWCHCAAPLCATVIRVELVTAVKQSRYQGAVLNSDILMPQVRVCGDERLHQLNAGLILQDLDVYATCGFEERSLATMQHVLDDGQHAHALARSGERTIAFAEVETHWPRRVWVSYVGVDAELRDRGLGSALVAWALERQFDAEAESALLMLSPANRTALRAYEKVGFRRHRLVDVLEKKL